MTTLLNLLTEARMAALENSWLAHRYGDRDPEVTAQAMTYERWLFR